MRLTSIVIVTAVTAFTAGSAAADEKPVRLREAPGIDKVEAHCGACHSLDYVQMNSPFLGAAGWNAEVAKMINAFGAGIEEADAKTIADYLNKNYGIDSSSLEKDKSIPEPTSSNFETAHEKYDARKSDTPRIAVRTSNHAPFKRASFHNRGLWGCSEIDRLISGSSCSRRPAPAFARSARRWPLVLN